MLLIDFVLLILFNNSPRVKSKSDDILYGFEKMGSSSLKL